MIRLLLVAAAGVLAACIIHIAVILLVPVFAVNDVWHRSETLSAMYQVTVLEEPAKELEQFPELDPGLCLWSVPG